MVGFSKCDPSSVDHSTRLAPTASASTTPATPRSTTTTPRTSAASARSAPVRFPLLRARLRRIVDEQRLQRQAVRQDVVANVVAADAERVQCDRIPVLYRHFDRLQVCVHCDIHARDRAVHLCAILQLDRHRFVAQFHQEPAGEGESQHGPVNITGNISIRLRLEQASWGAGLLSGWFTPRGQGKSCSKPLLT